MKARIILLGLILFRIGPVFSQFTVMINDKPIKASTEVELYPIQSLGISFTNATKIPEYTVGRASLFVNIEDMNGNLINQWTYAVDGYTALENFLYPKKAQTFYSWGANGKYADMERYQSHLPITTIFEDFKTDPKYRKLTATVNLIFEESIGYEKYGKKQVLLDKFTFYYNVWSHSNKIPVDSLGLTYNYIEGSEYKKMRYEKEAAIAGLANEGAMQVQFNNFTVYIRQITINNSQDDAINAMKQHFENYLNYHANKCNGKKILKNMIEPDASFDWKTLTGLASYSVLADLDQKNNPNFANTKIFEPFTAGNISGYKYKGIRQSHKCSSDGFIVTVEGPANPKERKVNGTNIMYIFKHPGNSKKILIFNFFTSDDTISNVNELTPYETEMEKFLGALSVN